MGEIQLQIVGVGFSLGHLKSIQLTLKYIFELILSHSAACLHVTSSSSYIKGHLKANQRQEVLISCNLQNCYNFERYVNKP